MTDYNFNLKETFLREKKEVFYLQNFADTHSYDVISYQLLTLLENLPWADLLNFFAHFHGPQIIPLQLQDIHKQCDQIWRFIGLWATF